VSDLPKGVPFEGGAMHSENPSQHARAQVENNLGRQLAGDDQDDEDIDVEDSRVSFYGSDESKEENSSSKKSVSGEDSSEKGDESPRGGQLQEEEEEKLLSRKEETDEVKLAAMNGDESPNINDLSK